MPGWRNDTVLVLDDDQAVRESLKFSLELEGFAVRPCANAAELLAHPDLHRACCLILDYKMPVLDGFEVLERLKEKLISLPVILIASDVSTTLRDRAARLGVLQVLEKPLSDSSLLENINIARQRGH